MKTLRRSELRPHSGTSLKLAAFSAIFLGVMAPGFTQDTGSEVPPATAGATAQGSPQASSLPPAFTATSTPLTAPPTAAAGTSYLAGTTSLDELPPLGALLQWGKASLKPYVSYRFSTGDGMASRTGQDLESDIHDLTLGLQLSLGDRWSVSYTPSWRYYSNDAFDDTVNHSASVRGSANYEGWDFGASVNYARSSDPLVETARQTNQSTWGTSLTASVGLNSKLGLDFGISGSTRSGGTFNNSQNWGTRDWLNYRAVPGLTFGAGLGYGITNVETGSDMSYSEIGGRVVWSVSRKLRVSFNAGWEDRKFKDSTRPSRTTPVYSGGLTYAPAPTTNVSIVFNRSVSASYFTNQVNDSSSANISFRQRLLQRFFLSVGYSKRWISYLGTIEDDAVTRRDRPETWNIGLNTTVLGRANAGIFYNRTSSGSNEAPFARTSTQYGAQIGYRF